MVCSYSKLCVGVCVCVCVHSLIGSGELSNIYFLSFHFGTYLIKYSNYG